jgi:hypothetical protein
MIKQMNKAKTESDKQALSVKTEPANIENPVKEMKEKMMQTEGNVRIFDLKQAVPKRRQ